MKYTPRRIPVPPKPFIDLDRHGRAWRVVKAGDLLPGDVVEDRGLVEAVNTTSRGGYLEIEFFSHERLMCSADDTVTAFTKPLTNESD